MKEEYLFWFSPCPAYDIRNGRREHIGTMPGHYYLAKGKADYRAAIGAGGKDVSSDCGAWAEWDAELNEQYMFG
jgi:hypothetical protein